MHKFKGEYSDLQFKREYFKADQSRRGAWRSGAKAERADGWV